MNVVYILLGGNVGDTLHYFASAKTFIISEIGAITRQSHIYKTAAWGNTDQPDFLNLLLIVETAHQAFETLHKCLSIEAQMGRIRTEKNAARIIDIDILFFNKEVIHDAVLQIPHPQIQNRRFVLAPLNELSPNFLHPVLQKTIHHLLTICPDDLDVKKN